MSANLPPTPATQNADLLPRKRTKLSKGILLNWMALGINLSVSFFLTPIIIRKLGNAGFGMWALIQSFSGYYGLINLGLTSALQRSIGVALVKNDTASLQKTVSSTVAFFSCTGSSIVVVAAALAIPAGKFFKVGPDVADAFALTVLLCATAVVLDFFNALAVALFTAAERFDWLNALGIGRQIIQASCIFLMLSFRPSTAGIALVVCLVSGSVLLVSWRLASRLYPGVKMTWRGGSREKLKELLHYGSSTVLLKVSNLVRLRVGNIIIAKTAGLAAVAQFSVASNLILNMNSFVEATTRVLTPRFTRLEAQSDSIQLKQLYRTALFGSSLIVFGMGLAIFIFSERFILFWLGPGYQESAKILKILALGFVVALAQSPQWNLMFAQAKHHFMSRVTAVESVVILALGLALAPRYGPLGFTWATAGTMLATKVLVQIPFGARLAGLSVREYVEPMSAPFVTALALFGAAQSLNLAERLQANGPLFFLVTGAITAVLYAGIACLISCRSTYQPSVINRFFPQRLTQPR